MIYLWHMIAERKYVFIAGGIGITPFRSMVSELLYKRARCEIVLFYQANTEEELLFRDIFTKAEEIGLRTVYLIKQSLKAEDIQQHAPRWQSRVYYISGPQGFVEEKRQMLEQLGIPEERIKTDLFTGYEV